MTSVQVLHETTKWDTKSIGYKVPNHIYLVRGNQILAYIQEGRGLGPIYFRQPMNFDRRGRTFVTLKGCPFDLSKVCL